MCGNPRCRVILTLEVHHITWVRDGGGNQSTNLLALCPNCHTLHTNGVIPERAIRHWKGMLHALNHAFVKEAKDLLLYLHRDELRDVWYSGDGVLKFAGLIAAGLVEVTHSVSTKPEPKKGGRTAARIARLAGHENAVPPLATLPGTAARVARTAKGRQTVEAWLAGDAEAYKRA